MRTLLANSLGVWIGKNKSWTVFVVHFAATLARPSVGLNPHSPRPIFQGNAGNGRIGVYTPRFNFVRAIDAKGRLTKF